MDIHAVGRRMTAWSIAGLLVTVPLVYTSDIFDYALLPKRLALFVWSALAFAGWSVTASSGRASISSGFPLYAVSAYTGLVVLYMINVSNMTVGSEELLFQLGLVGLFLVGAVARRSDTELWCWILIGVGGLVSLVGILQYFGFAPSLSIPSNGPPSAFFGYRNFAAMFLIGVIPVAAVMAIRAPGMWASALAVLSAVLSMLFLLYTRSRGAWLGIAVGTVMTTGLAALLPQTRFLISNAWRDGSRAKLGLAAAAIVLLAFAAPLPARFTDTGLQRFDEKKSDLITTVASITWDTGDRGRKTMWERSLPLILDHKWTGVGPGHWEFVYPKYDRGHMPGFRWFPGGQVVQRSDEVLVVKNTPAVFVCDGKVRATQTASWYRQFGFQEIYAVNGGTVAWADGGLELEEGMPDQARGVLGKMTTSPKLNASTSPETTARRSRRQCSPSSRTRSGGRRTCWRAGALRCSTRTTFAAIPSSFRMRTRPRTTTSLR